MPPTSDDSVTANKAEKKDLMAVLESVIEQSVAPAAEAVDREGRFPRAAVQALGQAGVLGATSAPEVGGGGAGLGQTAEVVRRIARACGSTAMIVLMHYAGTAVIEMYGAEKTRRAIAEGIHLTSLAFSETGSRSHFWAPEGTARGGSGGSGDWGGSGGSGDSGGSGGSGGSGDSGGSGGSGGPGEELVRLDARKSWVTSAGEADSYVWSSRPLRAEDGMSLWLLPSETPGLSVADGFDGLGLRGNASCPVTAEGVRVPASALLGEDGAGMDIALQTALPRFLILNAACSLGLMEELVSLTEAHLTGARLSHLGQVLADQPAVRARYAAMRIRKDQAAAFLSDTVAAVESGREDATLRVLQVKAVAAEAAAKVADEAMRLCGGSAFRRESGIERRFRDAVAARVMAPTTEALHEFVARASLGLPLFESR